MSEIKKGMVVRLKSGGPKMSVVRISDYSEDGGPEEGAVCSWFDEKNKHEEKLFDATILEEVIERPGPLTVTRA
ncbi:MULTISPECIES: DUF2158 domain-containing protein [Massilia]|uniref:DUF2158 domain-containing protein n=1 Tax=Massilia genomosp. 1 TaxID=2609280 RepID=A0ABX0MIL7_9BURK|nr:MULTISPECIES: DUF2158 domain-containing protein [Massilia]NHZ62627.1 DUF2158 domain-containing protein [Massilia genomosp. 1]NIA00097.1 DUF2158 domain-containing protein [Massilia sp. CCM 8734]